MNFVVQEKTIKDRLQLVGYDLGYELVD